MKVNVNLMIDTSAYFTIAQVGSSIYGKLLKPNDFDIAIGFKFPLFSFKKAWTFKLGKLNIILIHGRTVQDYIHHFDMDILHGYKNIITRKLHLFPLAKQSLKDKIIRQYKRQDPLFMRYDKKAEEKARKERFIKYKNKLPDLSWKIMQEDQYIENIDIEHE